METLIKRRILGLHCLYIYHKNDSYRNNKKRKNLEYYFITCIFPNIKFKSGLRISCSVRRKLFGGSYTNALTPNLLGISTILGAKRGKFKRCNSHVTAYISVLKLLQVSVKSITHFKIVIALYMPVLFLSTAIHLKVPIQSS